jgi:hypothetical protein
MPPYACSTIRLLHHATRTHTHALYDGIRVGCDRLRAGWWSRVDSE